MSLFLTGFSPQSQTTGTIPDHLFEKNEKVSEKIKLLEIAKKLNLILCEWVDDFLGDQTEDKLLDSIDQTPFFLAHKWSELPNRLLLIQSRKWKHQKICEIGCISHVVVCFHCWLWTSKCQVGICYFVPVWSDFLLTIHVF